MISDFRLADATNIHNFAIMTLTGNGYELGIYSP